MKICIPTMGNKGLEDTVNEHFGRSSYYTVIDTDTNDINVISSAENKTHGTCSPVELILDSGAEALICKGIGMKAMNFFSNSNISVYTCNANLVKNALEMFQNNKLVKMNPEDGCASGHHHKDNC